MNRHWYEDAVVYHVFTLSLAQAPPENDYRQQSHKFKEIEKWIPHIKSIGCDTILFSPLLKARSHGYDVTDYFQIDNRLGTNEEFAALVAQLHKNGIKVMLDSVFNHCGRDFFAFKELQNGNRDYAAWFSGVNFNATSPLGDSFTYDTWSGHFSLPKFNPHNHETRQYLFDAARFWIDTFDIDAMRLDAANTLDFDFMRELRGVCLSKKPDFWLMGEVVHGDYARWVNENTLHSVTNYMLYKAMYSSHNDNNLFELAHTIQNSQPQNGLPLFSFVDNHDQPRIADNIKNPGFLKTLYALLFTVPGVPSIYYGSEWGIPGKKEGGSDAPLRPCIDIDNPPGNVPWLAQYIKKLADARAGSNALKYGSYRQIYLEYRKPLVFERSFGDEKVYTAINIGDNDEIINLSQHQYNGMKDLLTGDTFTAGETGAITVKAMSARVLRLWQGPAVQAVTQSAVAENALKYEPAEEPATNNLPFEEGKHYTYSDYTGWDEKSGGKPVRYELYDGIPVVMDAPSWQHQQVSGELFAQIHNYLKGKPCKVFAAPFDVRFNADGADDTVLQPDILVICSGSAGGNNNARLDKSGCIGPPDMVIEIISPGTVRYDRFKKLQIYEKYGVREYWIVDPEDNAITVYILENGHYFVNTYVDCKDIPVHILQGCVIDLTQIYGI